MIRLGRLWKKRKKREIDQNTKYRAANMVAAPYFFAWRELIKNALL